MTKTMLHPDRVAHITTLCQQYHIRKLAISGSFLGNQFTSQSDVDLLIEFDANHTPDFFLLDEISHFFSAVFGGRDVDLVTYKASNAHLRLRVLAEAQVVYEKG